MVHQQVLIFGRDSASGLLEPFANNRGALDVFIQDQNSPIVNWVLHQDLNDIQLLQHTTIDSKTIEVSNTPAHNIVVGNVISLLQDTIFYQGFVVNVSGTTITLDSPLDSQFRIDRPNLVSIRGNTNAAVNGAATTAIFHATPPNNQKWDLTQLIVYIVDDVNGMDDTTLGGIAAVTNGLVLRKKNTVYDNIGNVKKNGDFKTVGCNIEYLIKVGGGETSMNAVCNFSNDAGITVRLDGSLGEEVELLGQDDLSDITSITAVVVGHVVE